MVVGGRQGCASGWARLDWVVGGGRAADDVGKSSSSSVGLLATVGEREK